MLKFNFCIWYFLTILFIGFNAQTIQAQSKKIILVIDPGHGGRDPGKPRGSKNQKHEKDINLAISLKLGNYVSEKIPNVKVLYTRSKDEYISLEDRVDFANSNQADYFISIHANSNKQKSIHGTESHIYGFEQKVSVKLAQLIQKQFETRAGRKSRGVFDANHRGHNLYVTQYTRMPSVLVEAGYLTNPAEEKYLNDDYGQAIIASAIFRAFRTMVQSTANYSENRKKYYRVQIMATQKPIDTEATVFDELEDKVEEHKSDNSSKYRYKYLVGREYDIDRAKALVRKLAKLGFKDAFVIEMED